MKVAIVYTSTESGEAGMSPPDAVGGLSSALVEAGHGVTVYVPDSEVTTAQELSSEGYRIVRVPADKRVRTGKRRLGVFTEHLERVWRVDRPDVVHAQSWLSGMAGQVAARAQGIAVVQSFAMPADKAESALAGNLVPVLARRADWMAANNTEELFSLLRMGCSRSRLSVIPGGVDHTVFTPAGPSTRRDGLPHRIVAVCDSSDPADLDAAVAAVAALSGTELVVAVSAGSPYLRTLRAYLRKAARAADVAAAVSVVEVDGSAEMAMLLRSADVYVCTARTDATGAAALMAMGCGVPVVAAAVGALVDIVVDEVTGRLVPEGQVGRFVEAIRRVLHEPFAGRGMGGAGRDRACSRYSWERVAADALRAYTGAATSTVRSSAPASTKSS
ncbi:MAG: glycosyltransferase [Mycobacterium sp.]